MPCPIVTTDKLPFPTFSVDIEVAGDLKASDRLIVGVFFPRQLVGEEPLHVAAAVLAGGKADGMYNNQIDGFKRWAGSEIWRGKTPCW